MSHRIAIVTDEPGWHGRQLLRSLARYSCDGVYTSLTEARFDLESEPCVELRGFERALPDGVFVRGVPGGSLEEVTFYLDILHALAMSGVPVYNEARSIERTVDKAMTSFLLRRAGIPTPATWVTRRRDEALAIAAAELGDGRAVVSKPLFGSQGDGLKRYRTPDELDELTDSNGIYYLQRFVAPTDQEPHDWRVFVIRDKAVAAMRRCGLDWLNNVAQGARCEPARLDDVLLGRLAEDAVRQIGMRYAGVDIIRDEHGRYTVLEVNSIPAWKGLQSVTEVDIASLLIADFLQLLPPARQRGATAG